jgi:hypothetical protein
MHHKASDLAIASGGSLQVPLLARARRNGLGSYCMSFVICVKANIAAAISKNIVAMREDTRELSDAKREAFANPDELCHRASFPSFQKHAFVRSLIGRRILK